MYDSTEISYPDLCIPPFWGISEVMPIEAQRLDLDPDQEPARFLYAWVPVISDGTTFVLLDPYSPHIEWTSIQCVGKQEAFLQRFRPEGDCLAISALTLPKQEAPYTAETLASARSIIATELRRGISLNFPCGELISTHTLDIPVDIQKALSDLLGIEDRLDGAFATPPYPSHCDLSFFVHNSSEEQKTQ